METVRLQMGNVWSKCFQAKKALDVSFFSEVWRLKSNEG